METIEQDLLDLISAIKEADSQPPIIPGTVIFTDEQPYFIRFTWTGFDPLTFVGFNSLSPLESLTPIGGHPGEWQYLAVIAPGATAAEVIAEIGLIAGVGPVKM